MKPSQWHNGNVKPVYVGLYERMPTVGTGKWSYWDGKKWCLSDKTKEGAIDEYNLSDVSSVQNSPWRGIVK